MSNKFGALLLLGFAWHLRTTFSQQLPPITCPEYFEYINREELYSGKITLRDLPFDTVNLQVKFSQRVPIESNFHGRLSFEHDLVTTQKKMENAEPITYLVEFPLPYVLPKLIRIVVNGVEVCSGPDYPDPKTTFALQRSFTPSEGTRRQHSKPVPTNNKDAPSIITKEGGENEPSTTSKGSQSNIVQEEKEDSEHTQTEQTISQDYESICGSDIDLNSSRVPWLTQIYEIDEEISKYKCSGSLLSSRTILSAASCLNRSEKSVNAQFVAVLGQTGSTGFVTYKIRTVTNHPEYRLDHPSGSDMTIITLEWPVRFTAVIRPICLTADVNKTIIEREMLHAPTWGNMIPNLFSMPRMLEMFIISFEFCKGFRSSAYSSHDTFCAVSVNSVSICTRDSGIGLVHKENGRWMLAGVLSAEVSSENKCDTGEANIFTDVTRPEYHRWIIGNLIS